MTARVVVLASGSGSVLQALLDSDTRQNIVAVGSDRPDCFALERARGAQVETFAVDFNAFDARPSWSAVLLEELNRWEPTLIVLAGFMRILDPTIVREYRNRIVNTHPALLPSFPGAHAVSDALAAGVRITGCTVHWVDEGVDTGPIIEQAAVRVQPTDDVNSLHERIKVIERDLLVSVVSSLVAARSESSVNGRFDGG